MSQTQPAELSVRADRRIGPKAAKALEKVFGITTVGEVLRHYPRRYAHLGELTDLSRLPVGEHVTVLAQVQQVTEHPMRQRRGSRVRVVIGDGRGTLELVFFAAKPFLVRKY